MEIVFTPYSVKRYCQKVPENVPSSEIILIYDTIRNSSLCFTVSDIDKMEGDTERSLKAIDAYIPEIKKLVLQQGYNTLVVSNLFSHNPAPKATFVRSRFVYPISRKNFLDGIFTVRLSPEDVVEEDRIGGEEKEIEREISILISREEYENARVPLREMEVKGLDKDNVYRISSMRHSILVDSSFANVAPDTVRVRLVHRSDAILETPTGYIDGSKTRRTPIYSVEGHVPREEEMVDASTISPIHLKRYLEEDNVEAIKQLYSKINHFLLIRKAIREGAMKCLRYLVLRGTKEEQTDAIVFYYLLSSTTQYKNDAIRDMLFLNLDIEKLLGHRSVVKRMVASVEGDENWNLNEDGLDDSELPEGILFPIPQERRMSYDRLESTIAQISMDYKSFLERSKFRDPEPDSVDSVFKRAFAVFKKKDMFDERFVRIGDELEKDYELKRSKRDVISNQPREVLENIASFVGTSGTMRSASKQLSRQRDVFHPRISYRAYDEEGKFVTDYHSLSESQRRELRYVPVDTEGRFVRDETSLIRKDVIHPNLQDWFNTMKTTVIVRGNPLNMNKRYPLEELRYIDFSKSSLPNNTLRIRDSRLETVETLFRLRNSGNLPVIEIINGGGVQTDDIEHRRQLLSNPEFIRWFPSGNLMEQIFDEVVVSTNLETVRLYLDKFPEIIRESIGLSRVIIDGNSVVILRELLDRGMEIDAETNISNLLSDRLLTLYGTRRSYNQTDIEMVRELLKHNLVPRIGVFGLRGDVILMLKEAGISEEDLHQFVINSVRAIFRNVNQEDDDDYTQNLIIERIIDFMNEMYIGGVLGYYFEVVDLTQQYPREALYHFNVERLMAGLSPEEGNVSLNSLFEAKPETAKSILTVIIGRLNRERNVQGESHLVRKIVEFLVEVRQEAKSRHQVWLIDMVNNALSPAELSPRSTRYLERAGQPYSPERPIHTIGRSSPELKMPEEKDMREWRGEGAVITAPSRPSVREGTVSSLLPYAGPEYVEEDYNPDVIRTQRNEMLQDRLNRLDNPYYNPNDDE